MDIIAKQGLFWPSRFLTMSTILALAIVSATPASGQEHVEKPAVSAAKPQWQRVLKGDDAKNVEASDKQISELEKTGHFAKAIVTAREVLAIRRRVQGDDHWQTVDALLREQTCVHVDSLSGSAQSALAAAIRQTEEGLKLREKAAYSEAEPLFRKALRTRTEFLGVYHSDTAESYNNLGSALMNQGKYAEAESVIKKEVEIKQRVLPEDHPKTAVGYGQLGHIFSLQGRQAEAEREFRKAIAINLRVLGGCPRIK